MFFEGVLDSLADEDMFKRAWAVVDSLRHIQHEVVHGVLEWLPTVPEFFFSGFSAKIGSALCGTYCVSAGPLLDSLSWMELRFEDGRLLVHPDFKVDASTPLPHHDDTVEFVADGRVDDIPMASLGGLTVATLHHASLVRTPSSPSFVPGRTSPNTTSVVGTRSIMTFSASS